jgi:hypothetical protein
VTAPNLFDTAKAIVYGDRERVYGDPGKNIRAIAALWCTYLTEKYRGRSATIDSDDVCAMMRLVKEARLMNTPDHMDSMIDIAGYAGVQYRIVTERDAGGEGKAEGPAVA